jgi:lipid-A-disaccharide synthase
MPKRVFITVAEVSGDQHAAQLVRSLRQLDPDIRIEGLGGPQMRQAGAVLHQETTGRAAMSWQAAFRALEISRLLKWTKRYFDRTPPDLQICVDSFAMNFHFAKAARERGIPVLYYIAPQLWASREGRMHKLRGAVDRVACILPFEEAYLTGHGVRATFVGHPLFDELPPGRDDSAEQRFPHRPAVIGLVPGSRRVEAVQNFPHLLEVAGRILGEFPDATFLVPTTPATHPIVEQWLERYRSAGGDKAHLTGRIAYELDGFDRLIPRCDLCLTKSGTSTLHIAGHGVPLIVVYRGSRILWHLIGRWIVKTRTYSLVNLLADRGERIVPEFIPWYGSNEPVAREALSYLRQPERLEEQRRRLRRLIDSLDHPGASMNVARLAMEMMNGAGQEAMAKDGR